MRNHILNTDHRETRENTREYFLYTAILFPVAFLTVLIRRFMPRTSSSRSSHRPSLGFLSEVMEMTRSAVPWVFMGR